MTLKEFFTTHNKVALAFSGGTDSAYLLCAGKKYGADVKPYFVKSEFQPTFELRDAREIARQIGIEVTVIELSLLDDRNICENPCDRCYLCKRKIFGALKSRANADGYFEIIDGTNASDDLKDRPGVRALEEYGVISPLLICGITKSQVRERSKKEGLFTWNKPSYSCLATRIGKGEEISEGKLQTIEKGEQILFESGFSDFRLRLKNGIAALELNEKDRALFDVKRDAVYGALHEIFDEITQGEWRK